MKLVQFGSNQTILIDNDRNEYFFSYETCVAGYDPILGYWRTTEYYSRTTTKHINKYLDGVGANVTLVQPSDINLSLSSF